MSQEIVNINGELRVFHSQPIEAIMSQFIDGVYGDVINRDDRIESDRNLVEKANYQYQKELDFISETQKRINEKS